MAQSGAVPPAHDTPYEPVGPLALGSTWTVLRQSRRPKIGGAAPRALPPASYALPPEPVGCRLPSANTRGNSARFRAGSCRNPYPNHYGPAFAFSPVLYPPPRRLALRLAYPAGGRRAYHVHRRNPRGLGPASTPVALHCTDESEASGPGHVPFWSKPISTFGLSLLTTLAAVHLGSPYQARLVPDRRGAGSRDLGSHSDRHPDGSGYVVPRVPPRRCRRRTPR